jgi:hypothetical protein
MVDSGHRLHVGSAKSRFSSTFKSDRLLTRINKLPPIGLPYTVPLRIWEPNETNFADG